MCEFCLEARDFDAKLRAHVAALEGRAQALRELIGRLDVPTHEEYLAAAAKHERAVVEFYEREEREREAQGGGRGHRRERPTVRRSELGVYG